MAEESRARTLGHTVVLNFHKLPVFENSQSPGTTPISEFHRSRTTICRNRFRLRLSSASQRFKHASSGRTRQEMYVGLSTDFKMMDHSWKRVLKVTSTSGSMRTTRTNSIVDNELAENCGLGLGAVTSTRCHRTRFDLRQLRYSN